MGVYEIVLEIYEKVNQGVLFIVCGQGGSNTVRFCMFGWSRFWSGPSFWFWPMAPGLFSMKTFRCFRFSNFILLQENPMIRGH